VSSWQSPAGGNPGAARRIKFIRRTLKRMTKAKHIVTALLIAACLAGTARTTSAEPEPHGRAYLFRGLIGLIDWGMDQLAGRISRSGVAANISSHLEWSSVANQAISDYRRDPKPISVVGHSIGGDAAVEFAEALGAAHVPVALLITYDPNRSAHSVPANVERYIDLYQSSNILGGGDLAPGHGFHGHYAAFNLNNRTEIIHVNMDKFDAIQQQLASKIRSAGVRGEGEAVPLRLVFPASGPIELWDSGVPVQAHAGDTLQTIATAYHVPLWAVAQINQKAENATLSEGQRIIVPRYVGQRLASRLAPAEAPGAAASPVSSPASGPASNAAPSPAPSDTPSPAASAAPAASEAPSPAASAAPSPAPIAPPSAAATSASSSRPSPAPGDAQVSH
jgi:LysM repeat protein